MKYETRSFFPETEREGKKKKRISVKTAMNLIVGSGLLDIQRVDYEKKLIVFSCPICNEGNSLGKKRRGYFSKGKFGCFNCGGGETWDFDEFFEKAGLPNPFDSHSHEEIENMLKKVEKEIDYVPSAGKRFTVYGKIPIWESPKAMEYVSKTRGIAKRVYAGWLASKSGNPVIPLVGDGGVVFGYQEKINDGSFPAKYKTIIFDGMREKYGKLYGYYGKKFSLDEIVFCVEGIFDAASIESYGFPAMATLGTGFPETAARKLGERLVYIPDNDEAGLAAAKNYENFGIAVERIPSDYKDFNEFRLGDVEGAGRFLERIRERYGGGI